MTFARPHLGIFYRPILRLAVSYLFGIIPAHLRGGSLRRASRLPLPPRAVSPTFPRQPQRGSPDLALKNLRLDLEMARAL